METWFIIVFSLCIAALFKSFINLLSSSSKKLPPGPLTVPIISNFLWIRRSFYEIELLLREIKAKYGPVITLQIGSRPSIFVGSHSAAHFALVQNGAVFSDRPDPLATGKILTSNQHNISSAGYGPLWRLLRRNLTSEILHPSRVKSYGRARGWVLHILVDRLRQASNGGAAAVKVVDHFQYAMFCLLVLMCFGDRLEEKQIKQIEKVQREMLLSGARFNVLNFWPGLGKIVFRNRWKELFRLRKNQEDVLIPLIRSRIEQKQKVRGRVEDGDDVVVAYVDTLADLDLPEEKRKLTESEMVSLCSEFLTAGTDTTSTALQWIMANLVKYPRVQAKLYDEIKKAVGTKPRSEVKISEEDVQRMPYLKAVVLEGLRRHPPGHFVLPHTVTEDVELEGYTVPKNGTINFMVAEMGWDATVWEDPMEFKPERFLSDGEAAVPVFDLTGSKEIKMMPFGAGRRICPGLGLALLHLEYFVANLVWLFEWNADGDDVDLSEKQEFTVVMKYPLEAHIRAREDLTLL